MEKFDHQEYRDNLAKDLKDLRSKGAEGRENAKALLDAEAGLPEYSDSMELHKKEIQEMLGEKASQEKEKKYKERVEKMKQIVSGLPFDYIEVPIKPDGMDRNAVLLKIQGTDAAFLVGDDLEKCGSDYGIKAGGEKMFILCGCRNCGHITAEFVDSLRNIAKENNINNILSRFAHYIRPDFFDVDKYVFDTPLLPKSVNDFFKTHKDFIPTKDWSDNMERQAEENNRKRNEEFERRDEVRRKEEQNNEKLLNEAYTLEDAIASGDSSAQVKLSEIIGKATDQISYQVQENIYKRFRLDANDVIDRIPHDLNVLCVSLHEGYSKFHMTAPSKKVKLEKIGDGNFTLNYPENWYTQDRWGGDKKQRVVGVRAGLDGRAIVIVTTPEETKDYRGRKDKTLELYTDIPLLETFSTPVEKEILGKKMDSFGVTADGLKKKADEALSGKRHNY